MIKVEDFIGDNVEYDESGQVIWGNKDDGQQLLIDVRGWGAIQNLIKNNDKATKFQDDLGKWFAEAINEKLNKERKND